MTKEDREVLSIVNPRGKEFRERYEAEIEKMSHTTNSAETVEEEEYVMPKWLYILLAIVTIAPVIFNGYIIWNHVVRTWNHFIQGHEYAFPAGWERYDAYQLIVYGLFIGVFSALALGLEYVYRYSNGRRLRHGV